MKKLLVFLCAVSLVLGIAVSAGANGFYEEFTSNVWFNSGNTTHTWTFDLDADSLYAGWFIIPYGTADINPEDTINWAKFTLLFCDDERDSREREYGDLTVDGNQWFSNEEIGIGDSIILANVTGLLNDHILNVKVDWVSGDFGVSFTSIIGCYTDNPAPVPEPATMFLLGLGLLGVAGIRRFKK